MEKPWKATVFPSDMIQKCDGCSSHGVKHQRLPAHHRQRLEIDPGPRRPRASASRRFRKPLLLHLWGWGSGPTGMIKSVKICGFQKPVATCEKLRWVRPLVSVLGHQEILLQDMNPTWSVRNLGIPWNEAFQDILESSILWELLVTVPVSTQFPPNSSEPLPSRMPSSMAGWFHSPNPSEKVARSPMGFPSFSLSRKKIRSSRLLLLQGPTNHDGKAVFESLVCGIPTIPKRAPRLGR